MALGANAGTKIAMPVKLSYVAANTKNPAFFPICLRIFNYLQRNKQYICIHINIDMVHRYIYYPKHSEYTQLYILITYIYTYLLHI